MKVDRSTKRTSQLSSIDGKPLSPAADVRRSANEVMDKREKLLVAMRNHLGVDQPS